MTTPVTTASEALEAAAQAVIQFSEAGPLRNVSSGCRWVPRQKVADAIRAIPAASPRIATLIQERDAALAEAASWHAACRAQTFSVSVMDTIKAERDAALKSSMDHALRLDALAKVIDRADAERNSLASQVAAMRDALLAMRPGNDAGGDVAYGAGWLRRKIDAALAASDQKEGGER